jgi:uncharacterized protein
MTYIDTDTHMYEPISLWTDLVDPKFKDRAPRWVEEGGRLLFELDEHLFPLSPGHPGYAASYGPARRELREMSADPEARLAQMDKLGADVQVIYPSLGLSGFTGLVREPAYAAALCRAYNRFSSELYASSSDRLRPAMLIPFNHPEVAVAELEWAREQGMTIAVTNPTPPNDDPWATPSRDPIWAAAESNGVMVVFHEVTTGCPPNAVGINRYTNSWPMLYLATHVIEAVFAMTDVILGGVCERFPKLNFGVAEAHVAWLPGWLAILDSVFGKGTEIHGSVAGGARLTLHPSEYFRRQVYLSAFPGDAMMAEAIAVGPLNITVSSDWPHPSGDGTRAVEEIAARDELSPELKERLLVGNAARMLGHP